MEEIRILLADDHKLMREGLRMLIADQANMEVVAEAEDGETAVAFAGKLLPGIVIMDISMPGRNGIEATQEIKAANPGIKVIALSMHLDKRMVLEMFQAGASGYLIKECAFHEVIAAITSVSADRGYISLRAGSLLAKEFIERFRQSESSFPVGGKEQALRLLAEGKDIRAIAADLHMKAPAAESECQQAIFDIVLPRFRNAWKYKDQEPRISLTAREKEILMWVKEGKNNWEIASILDITQDTVKYHLKNIFQKLNVSNRSQAVSVALEEQLI